MIALVILFLISVEIKIFGWPLTSFLDADTSHRLLYTLGYIMLGLMLLTVLAAFAHDIQQQVE